MWRRVRIEQAADIISGGTPSRSLAKFWGDGIAWATPTDITACRRPVISETADSITREGLLNSSAKQLPAGSILLTSRATIGEARIAGVPISTNQGFKSLVPKPGYDATFLYYQILALRGQFERYGVGSTFPEISKRDVARVEFDCPDDEEEQRRIGRILWSVDTQITHTEALTAKQEQVRAGLMQDLLTRGVDETGRLRPPREEEPALYHETALGWLPKGWETAFLSDCAPPYGGHLKTGPFGSSLKISHWVEAGHPVITIGSLGVGSFVQDELLFVGPETARRLEGYRVAPGDIVFSRVADVGRSVVVDEASDGWIISSNLMRLRVDSTKLRPEIVHFQLAYDSGLRAQLRRTVNSSGRDVANAEIMNALRFLSPPIAEQDQICELARQQQQLIQVEAGLLQKLRHQRTALLRDLLTPPTTAAAEPRIAAE